MSILQSSSRLDCSKASTTDIRSRHELSEILSLYFKSYCETHKLSLHQHKVMRAILDCRTSQYGAHIRECDVCGYTTQSYNSCKDRHCPKCLYSAQQNWLSKQMSDLLDVPYYHVVFTLPHILNDLALCNKELLYDLLLKVSAAVLHEFGGDSRHLGGQLGFTSILHTWGQDLNYHIHVHIIIVGGALSRDGSHWLGLKFHDKFLFAAPALSKVYRGKFIDALKKLRRAGKLSFPGALSDLSDDVYFEHFLDTLASKRWVIYIKRPFGGADQVLKYIGRYTHRVAISNYRLLDIADGVVTFLYKDYRDSSKTKVMRLSSEEFIRRFLLHIIPSDFKRIRHYGFLSNSSRKKKVARIRELLKMEVQEYSEDAQQRNAPECPVCGEGKMIFKEYIPYHRLPKGWFAYEDTS